MDDNVKTFLDKIQELKNVKIKVLALSLGKEIDSSSLAFKQQKDLISTIADGAVGALKFQKIINELIIENTGENALKVTDKLPIILKLRMDSIGDTIKFGEDEVSLQPILEKSQKLKFKQTKTIKGVVTICLEVPTLPYESHVIQATMDILKKDGETEIGKNIGNIYTYEIVKYIKSIKFGEQEVVFPDIPIRDRVKIVDNLPLATNKEIISFIQDIKKKETDLLTVVVNGEEKSFDIDVRFFDS